MNRKIVYTVIYVGVAFAFPALPLGGLKLIGGFFTGAYAGVTEGGKDYVVEEGKEKAMDIITQVEGPLWKVLNPFE